MESNLPSDIVLMLVLGTLGMVSLTGFIVLFVFYYQKKMLKNKIDQQQLEADYQQQLLQSTIDSQEKERKRIASELHDGVGAMLSAAKLNLGMIATGAIPAEEAAEATAETKQMIDETIETVRRISKDLLPSSLEQFGFGQAINELCQKLSNSQTQIRFEKSGSEALKLTMPQQLLLYRICQELINNALKHAQASEVDIMLLIEKKMQLLVKDNGKGFEIEKIKGDIKKGVGLYNIENRVSLLNGTVTFKSELGKGTQIAIEFAA